MLVGWALHREPPWEGEGGLGLAGIHLHRSPLPNLLRAAMSCGWQQELMGIALPPAPDSRGMAVLLLQGPLSQS